MSLTKDHASEGFYFFFSRFQALKNSQEIPIFDMFVMLDHPV